MDDVTIAEATLAPRCSLHAYSISETRFEDLALASYFASGKFDKASMHRWATGNLLVNPHKAQNFRASVDNAVLLLPVGNSNRTEDDDPLAGNIVMIGFEREGGYVPVCLGVTSGEAFKLCRPYADHVLPVHVVTTLCGKEHDFECLCERACGVRPGLEWKQHPRLPGGLHVLVQDLGDALFESQGATYDSVDGEYVRQHVIAAGFARLLECARDSKTPSPPLDAERLARIDAIERHVRAAPHEAVSTRLPPTRRTVGRAKIQQLDGVMATYEKYAAMFGRLLEKK